VHDPVIRHPAIPREPPRPPATDAAAAAKPLVRLRNIGKVYSNGTVALRDLNLDVAPLEFVSLLGPSGCGKSTALRMIAGLGNFSDGTIDWPTAQHDAHGRPERELGFVFQEPTLMPWASVFDNVYLPFLLKDRPKSAVADRVRAALDLVGLTDFAGAYPRELSGGMKMRVSIARAIVTQPKLLLLDEPFAALDEIARTKLNNDLLAIWQKARCTVMFVTHSVYESVYLSNRIIVMAARPGRVIGELKIDAPYPRDTEYRLSRTYSGYCRRVSELLDQAMTAGDA
jgi:NitT/TauT family transport system ATP-binding protein